MFRATLVLTAATLFSVLSACDQASTTPVATAKTSALQYEDAWIREAPPGMQMMAGYVTIQNNSEKDFVILSTASEAFIDIEMHKTEVTDSTARMIEQENLPIPAGGSMELSPGGYHLMLMMPSTPLKVGDKVKLDFSLEGGSTDNVEFEVLKAPGNGGEH
jgi:copper(I)-binding protein